jgi:alkylation response protein AidB-like acyl-CoA dehydrogenase
MTAATSSIAATADRNDLELTAAAACEASRVAAVLAGLPTRQAWTELVALPSASRVMRASFTASRGDGAVLDAVAVIEGLGRGGIAPGLVYALASQVFGIQWPLAGLAGTFTDSIRDGIIDGSIVLCHALTEDTGGSDPLSMTTHAETTADTSFVLTGRKAYVTAAPIADRALVFARTSPGRHPFALSAFLIPTDRAGVTVTKPFDKRAIPEIPMGALEFDGVRIEPEEVVAPDGAGLAFLSTTTTWERALLMSYAVGTMYRTLEHAVEWARTRHHFDRPMGSSPLVAARIADMAMLAHRVRALVRDIASKVDSPARLTSIASEAAMVKISCAQDLLEFETTAGRLFGARSVIADSDVFSDLSGALAASIYAGTNDLLRIGVARDLSLPVEN